VCKTQELPKRRRSAWSDQHDPDAKDRPLEERIGFKLFLRDQSGLTLSEDGLAMTADVTEMERPPSIFFVARRSHE